MPPERSYLDPLAKADTNLEDGDAPQHDPSMNESNQSGRSSFHRRESFVVQFAKTKGPPQIVILILILALALGSTVGVVPAVMTDRFARLNHGYVDTRDCADYTMATKPEACLMGSADAQNAAAYENLVNNVLTFITGSLTGSISDETGRRGVLLLGLSLLLLSPICLVLTQLNDSMSPLWYYSASATTGLVSWIAVSLSSISDVLPPQWRSAGFGLLLAGFSLGFGLSPILAILFDHFRVSIVAMCLVISGFLVTLSFFPETLPPEVSREAMRVREAEAADQTLTGTAKLCWTVMRPVRELAILNRSSFFRLLTALAFFSGMVAQADQTLLVYYLEERLAFDDHDVAIMFSIIGTCGIVVQAGLIKPFTDCLGERLVIIVAFFLGSVNNLMYGFARDKETVFIALVLSSFTGMAFPTISAIKANNVEESEQGRIQGALYSVQALASGTGPVLLRFVYHETKDNPYPGPGTMFIFAAAMYLVAVACAVALPKDKANSKRGVSPRLSDEYEPIEDDTSLSQPIL